MQKINISMIVVVVACFIGCEGEPPASSQVVSLPSAASALDARKPFLVKTHAGVEHAFYRGLSLDEFLKLLPSGSVDSLDLDFVSPPQVFGLVTVPDEPGRDLTQVRFETTFKMEDGQVIEKRWTAAKDRKSGKAIAVFCFPGAVVEGETKVVVGGERTGQ